MANLSSANASRDVVSMVTYAVHHPLVFGLRGLFYGVTPAETSFEKLEQVPKYVDQAIPFFMFFVLFESLLLKLQGRGHLGLRLNDGISSVSAGIFSVLPGLAVGAAELLAYIYIYDHWRLYSLPWDSPLTWWFGFLGVDFFYYWFHRMGHEMNIFWAGHQTHHNSDDYNLTTALRQSVIHKYIGWVFYLPLALVMPPSIFVVHIHFNLIYQFWIHTQAIDTIGPLEFILNTPSHHRVHHGRNRYCIDKNYGGTLIIWDRLFGTFEAEKEEVVYGLVHPLESWNALYVQFGHLQYMLNTAWNIEGWSNKLRVVFYGPGWEPGKPRTGLLEDLPDVHAPQPKFDQEAPFVLRLYCALHLLVTIAGYGLVAHYKAVLGMVNAAVCMMYMLASLASLGFILDNKWYAPHFELLRCLVYLAMDVYVCSSAAVVCCDLFWIPRTIFLFSASIWLVNYVVASDSKSTKTE